MKETLFIRLMQHEDKGAMLAERIAALRVGQVNDDVFAVVPESFHRVPNTPFCYWASNRIRRLFTELSPFEGEGRTVKQGLATADDFRFVRTWWEVPTKLILDGGQCAVGRERRKHKSEKTEKWTEGEIRKFQAWCRQRTCEGKRWVLFAKGGEYSTYYADVHLVVNWVNEGAEIKNNLNEKGGVRSNVWMLRDTANKYFFRPGLTWPARTQLFGPRLLPAVCIFSHKGCATFVENDLKLRNMHDLSLMNSKPFLLFLEMMLSAADTTARSFEVGIIQNVPIPRTEGSQDKTISNNAFRAWFLKRSADLSNEVSHAFELPALLQTTGATLGESAAAWERRVAQTELKITCVQAEIDEFAFKLYGFTEKELNSMGNENKTETKNVRFDPETAAIDPKRTSAVKNPLLIAQFLSWCFGVVLGRFDMRLALDSSLVPGAPDPFDPLPVCPPGMLVGPDGLPAEPGQIVSEEWLGARPDAGTLPPEGSVQNPTITDEEYPIRIPWDGILVDDPGFNGGAPHRDDIVRRVREVLDLLWGDRAQAIEEEACEILDVADLREYFREPSGFFQDHLKCYSKSRRKAPIYWPLSTSSGSYTVWLYYHRLNDQTLYAVVNKYLEPKIADVERAVNRLEIEISEGAKRGAANLRDRLSEGQNFLMELREFREELLRVAGLPYKPNLNDGVIITAAPLHKLFRLRSWAKDTESCRRQLEQGAYDWAHLAYTLWPERVKEVCRRDRSIAIAHGLEEICETELPGSKRKSGRIRRKRGTSR